MERISFAAGVGVPGWVVTQGKPLIISEAQDDERVHPIIRQKGIKSLVSAPLVVAGRPLGALVLFSSTQAEAFDENDLRLVGIYADLAAVAIDNARLYQQAEEDRSKLAAVLSDTTDAVVVLDQTSRVLLSNPAAVRYPQLPADQTINRSIADLGVADLATALEAAQEAQAPIVREITAPAGRALYVSVSPVRDVGWVMVMQEVGPLNEEQKEVIQVTQRGIHQLSALVTDVLDLARLEAGSAPRLSPIDPRLPRVFDRFYRVPGSEDQEGSGLGLYTVKTIVEKHGGQVTVQSTPGQGSTFASTIPQAE